MTIFLLPISLFASEKPRLAVADLEAIGVDKNLARTTSELLRTELFKTGYFSVMERSQMERLLEEWKLHLSGVTEKEDIVKIGEILVVQYFVIGSINRLGQNYIINIRLVDVEKAKLIAAETVEVQHESEILGAVRTLARKIIELTPLRGKVVRVKGNEVLLSLGSQDRVEPGMVLRVQRLGETFKDPSTGRVIGREVIEVGVLRLTKIINEELSSATVVEDYGRIEVGDIVTLWVGAPAFQERPKPVIEVPPESTIAPQGPEIRPEKSVEVTGFLFVLEGCRASTQGIMCVFTIKNNTKKERELLVSAEYSRIINDRDGKGYKKEYPANRVKLEDKESRWHVSKVIGPLGSLKATLYFQGFTSESGEIPLVEIAAYSMGNLKARFANIPVAH